MATRRLTKHATDVIDYALTLHIRSASLSTKERKLLSGGAKGGIDDQYDRFLLERSLMEKPLGLWSTCKGDVDVLMDAVNKLSLDATARKKIDDFLVKKIGV